jgi:hypothetical protein
MKEYDGTTSLKKALEQLHGKKLSFDGMAKITNKHRERLNISAGKAITKQDDKLKIYRLERDAITQNSLIESIELASISDSSADDISVDAMIEILEHKVKRKRFDVVKATKQKVADAAIESINKFISINYRHADNSRHTVKVEQFYIDALKAIGIDDIAAWVALNAGLTQVTRNVKRSVVNELLKIIKLSTTLTTADDFSV